MVLTSSILLIIHVDDAAHCNDGCIASLRFCINGLQVFEAL